MATYTELFNVRNDSALKNRVSVACVVAAEAIRVEDGATLNNANRLVWAATVMRNPQAEGARMLWALLAANKDVAVGAITGADDATIQSAVDNAVDLFAQ